MAAPVRSCKQTPQLADRPSCFRCLVVAMAPEIRRTISERDLAAAWNDDRFRGRHLLVDGRAVEIVHRGTWTHGFGPDFRDAMIAIDGVGLQSGSIELHFVTSGWRAHGHHLDPRYDDVVLHVVQTDDGAETRRQDGRLVPVMVLPAEQVAIIQPRAQVDWSLVGGEVCAAELSQTSPAAVRSTLQALGDTRIAAKVARLESLHFAISPADVLYREIWDGLGYAANREPMTTLARRMPIAAIEAMLAAVAPSARLATARGLLFGLAGFLPLSPSDANAAGLSPEDTDAVEHAWRAHGSAWHDETLPPTAWTRARVRPANHPALRLSAAASLLSNAPGGLLAALLDAVRAEREVSQILQELCAVPDVTALGPDRANAIAVNAVLPFTLALAEQTGDQPLGERAARQLEMLPGGEPNDVTRRALRQVAGDARIPHLGARGQQGLIHLDQTLCRPRRCYECPIAALVVEPSAISRQNV
jgi:hypothetical protein